MDGVALAEQIACLRRPKGGKKSSPKRKEANHEFFNPIVGFGATQAAAAAAAVFSNAVIEATYRVKVRPCRRMCMCVKARKMGWGLHRSNPQALQLNRAGAGCFYKGQLLFCGFSGFLFPSV